MKTLFCFVLVMMLVDARANELTTTDWGAVSNEVQMSISLDSGNTTIKTNTPFQLLVQIRNLGRTNISTYSAAAASSDAYLGLQCTIESPSGRDVSPNMHFRGDSGIFLYVAPSKVESFKFDLSDICKFDQVGVYKITARKTVMIRPGGAWTIVSNPLFVTVVSTNSIWRVNATKRSDGSLTLALDAEADQRAVLSSDGTGLSAVDKSGAMIWSNNIISQMGRDAPRYFRGRIDSMYTYGEILMLRAGNGFYYIDKSNGKITGSQER